jgi:6-phosphogluconolactonase (cycloisomerase 2 family)
VAGVDGLAGARSVALSPDGAHVYVASERDDAVAVFARNAGTGMLTFVEVEKDGVGGVDGLADAQWVTLSPDGAHVYVASAPPDDAVAVFARNAMTGALTFVEAEKDGVGGVDGLDGARAVAVSPDGAHVYVASDADAAVAVFSRSAGTGALTFVETKQDGVGGVDGLGGARSVAVSPDGAHVYVEGVADGEIAVFGRNAATGALTFIEAEPNGRGSSVVGLDFPSTIVPSADGAHLYAVSPFGRVAVFGRNAGTGALTLVQVDPSFQGGDAVAVSPDGAPSTWRAPASTPSDFSAGTPGPGRSPSSSPTWMAWMG